MCKTILVVEDQPDISELFTAIFSDSAYEIFYAKDGEEALSMAADRRPDLILLDVRLPKLNGFEVCRSIKKNPALLQTRIILLSSQMQQYDFQEARNVKADGFMAKPFKPIELMKRVDELLGGKA